MAHYGKPEYWDDRYTKDSDQFDWYQRYAGLKDILKPHINTNHAILNIGCGSSRLSEEMHDDGYQNITNIDISSVVIKQMTEKYKEKYSTLKFAVMDAKKLEFPEGSFDVIIDKGTLDSILCGDNAAQNAELILSEIHKVLAPLGVYICISYGVPEQREIYYKGQDWEIKVNQVKKPNIFSTPVGTDKTGEDVKKAQYHYVYVMKKHDASEKKMNQPKEQQEESKKDDSPTKEENEKTFE